MATTIEITKGKVHNLKPDQEWQSKNKILSLTETGERLKFFSDNNFCLKISTPTTLLVESPNSCANSIGIKDGTVRAEYMFTGGGESVDLYGIKDSPITLTMIDTEGTRPRRVANVVYLPNQNTERLRSLKSDNGSDSATKLEFGKKNETKIDIAIGEEGLNAHEDVEALFLWTENFGINNPSFDLVVPTAQKLTLTAEYSTGRAAYSNPINTFQVRENSLRLRIPESSYGKDYLRINGLLGQAINFQISRANNTNSLYEVKYTPRTFS